MADTTNFLLKIVGEFEDKISGGLKELTSGSIPGLIGGLAALTVALGAVGLSQFVLDATEAGDALEELSHKTGIAVEDLSEWKTTLEVNNISLDGFATSIARLSKNLVEAQDATSNAGQLFKQLNIETKDSEGNIRNASDVMKDLADRFSTSANDANKVTISMELLGRSGRDMIPMLNDGREKLEEFDKAGKDFGRDWNLEQATQAAEFNDNLNLLSQAAEGFWEILAKDMLPTLVAISDEFVRSYQEGGFLRDILDGLAALISNTVIPALKILVELGSFVTAVFQQAGYVLAGFAAAATLVAELDFAGAKNALVEMSNDVSKVGQDFAAFHDKLWGLNQQKAEQAGDTVKKTLGVFQPIAKGAADDAKKVADEYAKAETNMMKALFQINAAGKASEVSWNNQFGTFAKFTDAQKEHLLDLAREIDLQTELAALAKQRLAWELDREKAQREASNKLVSISTVTDPIKRAGDIAGRAYLEDVKNYVEAQRELIKNYEGEAKAKAEAALAQWELNNATDEAAEKYVRAGELVETLSQKTKVWSEYITTNRDRVAELTFARKELDKLYESGKITLEEYTGALEKNSDSMLTAWANQTEANARFKSLIIDDRIALEDLTKSQDELTLAFEKGTITAAEYQYKMQQVNDQIQNIDPTYATDMIGKMNDEMKNAAGAFEGMFADYLFDGMQGKWNDLGDAVKKIIDRMVANMIAAQLQMALFGDLGSTPAGKTPESTGILGGIFSSIFSGSSGISSMFRAEGGPVEAGKSYIVGERRAELFTPTSDGVISPSVSGNNVSFNITAMDGQDVMRTLANNKRDIAEMVFGAGRQYNLMGAS